MLDEYTRFTVKYDLAILVVLIFGLLALTVVTANDEREHLRAAEDLRR